MSANAEQEVRLIAAKFERAFEAKDANALAELYSSDATLITHGTPPVHGREAIHKKYIALFANIGGEDFTDKNKIEELFANGDLASVRGRYIAESPSQVFTGEYVWVLKRLADDKWYVHTDFFTMETEAKK